MAEKSFRYFVKGIELRGESSDPADNLSGSVWHNSTSGKLKAYIESAIREIITADQTQTLTNKTIDADNNTVSNLEVDNFKSGVVDTDGTLAANSDTKIATQKAVKTYVDTRIQSKDEASEITVNDSSFVQLAPAGNVQLALENTDGLIDYQTTQINNIIADVKSGAVVGYDLVDDTDVTPTSLTSANKKIRVTGTIAHSINMPDPTTLANGSKIEIVNYGSGTTSVYKNDGITLITTLPPSHKTEFIITNTSTETYIFDVLPARTAAGYNFANKELLNVSTPTASTSAANKSYVDAHINDTTDAHAASAITNTPSGNLSATDVQSALNELQTDIDSHLSDTTPHATIQNSSIETPSRLDPKNGTKGALTTYALTAQNGELVFATDTKEFFYVKDGLLTEAGGGGSGVGGTDIMIADTADKSALTDYTQTGLEIIDTPVVLHGTKSFRLQHTTSIKSFKKVIAVDRKFRGKNITAWLDVVSSAASGNVNILFYDETNSQNLATSQIISTSSQALTATTANASNQLTGMSASAFNTLKVGMVITGSAIPVGTTITALNVSTLTATMSANATGVSSGIRISDLVIKRSFSFNIPNNCQSMSWTISTVVENYAETYIDDIVLQLSESAKTSYSLTQTTFNATDWTPYTPTFTGFGTPSAVEFEYRQVGGNYEIRGKFTSGTTTATEARISLPAGATSAGTSVIPSISVIGSATRNTAVSAGSGGAWNTLIEPSVSYVTFGVFNANFAGLTKQNASAILNTGDTMAFFASVPIAGLTASTTTTSTIPLTSSVLVTQPDSYFKMNGILGLGSTGTTVVRLNSANITSNIGSDIQYISDSVNGDRWIALTSGTYTINYSFSGELNNNYEAAITLNSPSLTANPDTGIASQYILDRAYNASSASTRNAYKLSWTGYLNAQDIIRIQANQSTVYNTSQPEFSMAKQNAVKIINPSIDQKIEIPTHELRFEGASARGSTDTAIVKFDTQAKIKGDGFTVVNTAANGTVVTIRKAGRLSVNASIWGNSSGQISISKNQTTLTLVAPTSETIAYGSAQGTTDILCASGSTLVNVGDIIRVSSSVIPSNTNSLNSFNIVLEETSVAVALQNVQPTYDNSDSAVRVYGGNGFGSTNTSVRRFTNLADNFGTDITYTDSATLGASFTINTSGLYDISFTEQQGGGNADFAIQKNSTTVGSTANTLAYAFVSSSVGAETASTQVYLNKGDVIYALTSPPGNVTSSSTITRFTISRVGKTSGTVDITPFVNIPQNVHDEFATSTANGFGSTATAYYRWTSPYRNTNNGVLQWIQDSVNGDYFKALVDCTVNGSLSANFGTSSPYVHITVWNSSLSSQLYGANTTQGYSASGTQEWVTPFNLKLNAGEIIRFSFSGATPTLNKLRVIATAQNNSVVSSTQNVSSDTLSFVFKSTAIDPNTDAVGTFNTYTYAANTNAAVIATTAPTQSVSDMNVNGVRLFSRAFNATSTAAQPARIDIFIGKGLKSKQVDAYAAAAKTTPISYDVVWATSNLHGTKVLYNELTGVLTLECSVDARASSVARAIDNETAYTSGYFVFNASKSPSLVSIPNLAPRIAYISEQQTSGTNGGSSVATTWTTRTLNTKVDNTGIINSLSSNTIVLDKGTYRISAQSPFYASNAVKLRLRNTTDNTTALVGGSYYCGTLGATATLDGEITITSTKSFQIQYYTSTSAGTNGLGVSTASGEVELFTQVEIIKIKD